MARSYRREEEEESGSESDQQPQKFVKPHKLFEDEHGRPIKFFLDRNINLPGARAALTTDIEKHGGRVLNSDKGVNTVLVNPRRLRVDIEILRDRYNVDEDPIQRDVYVEPLNFVQNCIRNKRFRHVLRPKQGIGGAPGRRIRIPYTGDDDDHLCHYLALKAPDKESGARSGNELYKNLVQMYDDHDPDSERYAWVRRHTWESWRQRYTKNIRRFDKMIADKVPIVKPSEKHTYHRDRRLGRGGRGRRQRGEEEELSGPSDDELSARGDDEFDELDSQDDEDMLDEDLEAHQGKRKRSDIHKISLPVESRAKRQRAYEDASSQRRASSVEHGRNSRPSNRVLHESKGKRKADSYQSVDNETHERSSLFSLEDEPGPSGTRPSSPSPLQRRLSHSPVALATQPQSSQMTLVDPAITQVQHRQLARKNRSTSFPSRRADTSRPFPTQVPPVKVDRKETTQPLSMGHEGALRTRPIQQPAAAPTVVRDDVVRQASSVAEPPKRTRVGVAPTVAAVSQVFTAATVKGVASKSKSKLKVPPPAVAVEAPYRNTRSRSRSVEPSGLGLKASTRAKKKGKAEKQRKTLETLDEHGSEDELVVETVNPNIPAGETLAEEQDVEDLLIADGTDQSGIGHREDEDVEEGPRHARRKRSRENSLDTDDQQIHNSLREFARQPSINSPFDTEIDPTEFLTTLKTHKLSRSSDKHLSRNSSRSQVITPVVLAQRNPNRNLTSRPVYSEPSSAANRPNQFTSPQPRTLGPSRLSRTASHSISQSSGESIPFPVSGTRASAMKNRLEEEEKRTPYKPPVGTRAARHAVPK